MSVTSKEMSGFCNNHDRNIKVAVFLLLSGQHNPWFVHYLVPIYKDNPTKLKAIAMYDLFFSEDTAYGLNYPEGCSEVKTLTMAIQHYREQRQTARGKNIIQRYITTNSRRAQPDVFDIMALPLMGDGCELDVDKGIGSTEIKLAPQIVTPLIKAGFKELKKLCIR